MSKFRDDLSIGQEGEAIVARVLNSLATGLYFTFTERKDQHKGDILAISADGSRYYFEVKNDSRIADTGNVLCEELVYFKDGDYYNKGFMYSDYQYYCVLSQQARKIYIIDFKKLQKIYKLGEYKRMDYATQYSDTFLVSLGMIKAKGALIDIIEY